MGCGRIFGYFLNDLPDNIRRHEFGLLFTHTHTSLAVFSRNSRATLGGSGMTATVNVAGGASVSQSVGRRSATLDARRPTCPPSTKPLFTRSYHDTSPPDRRHRRRADKIMTHRRRPSVSAASEHLV